MSIKELFTKIQSIAQQAHNDIKLLTIDILQLEDDLDSAKYSEQHKSNVIRPRIAELKRDREDTKEDAKKRVEKLAREYMAEQAALDELRGDQINEDARLLTCGIKLTASELEKMFDRNDGNGTMQQIVCRYARENGMGTEFKRAYFLHSASCAHLDQNLSYETEVALKYYNDDNAYNRIAGEGGIWEQRIAEA